MKKYRIKKSALYIGLLAVAGSGVFGIYTLNSSEKPIETKIENITDYEQYKPVINNQTFLNKPYKDEEVNILKNFYDKDSEETIQENSIIYYDSTYMQNSSVAYGGPDKFDVLAVLDGKVIDVKSDELVGNVIEIEHENGITSIYQSVSEIKVKKDNIVSQGELIATSGTSKVNKNLNSHLLFELIIDKEIVNPENYFGKEISKIRDIN